MDTISVSAADLFLSRIRRKGVSSLRELAKRAQVSHTAISLWLSGKRPLSPRAATQMAKALNTTAGRLYDLLEWQEPTPEPTPDAKPGKPRKSGLYFDEQAFKREWERVTALPNLDADLEACERITAEFFLPLAAHYIRSKHCQLRNATEAEAEQAGAVACLRRLRKFDPKRASGFNFFTKIVQRAISDLEGIDDRYYQRHLSVDSGAPDLDDGDRAAASVALIWANTPSGKIRHPARYLAQSLGMTLDVARQTISAIDERRRGCRA